MIDDTPQTTRTYTPFQDDLGWTPLRHAAYFKEFEIVKLLVERGADIWQKDEDGLLCVHESFARGDKVSARYLMRACCHRPEKIYLPGNGPTLREMAEAGRTHPLSSLSVCLLFVSRAMRSLSFLSQMLHNNDIINRWSHRASGLGKHVLRVERTPARH